MTKNEVKEGENKTGNTENKSNENVQETVNKALHDETMEGT